MPLEDDIPFLTLVKESFDSIFKTYGFEVQGDAVWGGQGEYKITAKKGDIELNFYLGIIPRTAYLCDVWLRLSGRLGEKTATDPRDRGMSILAIAKYLDPEYKPSIKEARTKDEVRENLEHYREDVLKYGKDILLGNVSIWSAIVQSWKEKKK